MKLIDITGQSFGKLVVRRIAHRRGEKRMWECDCSCGQTCFATANELRSGKRLSCGCFSRESLLARITTNGGASRAHPIEYKCWRSMRRRCDNPTVKFFHNYGGRGIRVCKRWDDSFDNFFADMGPRPSPKHSIDRYPNNNGNYEPGNCRWATAKEQRRNQRNNHILTLGERSQTVTDWAEELGLDRATITNRVKNRGLERALTTPRSPSHRPRRLQHERTSNDHSKKTA